MSSSTLNIEAEIRKLQEQKIHLEKQAKEIAEKNKQTLRIACLNGDKTVVETLLLSEIDISYGQIYYDRTKAENDDKQYEWQNNGKCNDAINNAIRGDHPDILKLLLEHAQKLLKIEIHRKNRKDRYGRHVYSDSPYEIKKKFIKHHQYQR